MKLSEFDYDLPKALIAQYPAENRLKCRLMVIERSSRDVRHAVFKDIVQYFNEDDCLILNDTRVIPARLFGKRKTGGRVEIFLLEKKNPTCEALIKPSARLKDGEKVILESGDEAEILGRGRIGRFVRFRRPMDDILSEAGHMPLPPYIDRLDEESDRADYQTVYSAKEGATASPTAGLHFTKTLIAAIAARGVNVAFVTLHTNYGTFAPVKEEDVEDHKMHREYFELPADTARLIARTKDRGGKIFSVGTTTTRVLEHCAGAILSGDERKGSDISGHTDMYIYPGYEFKVVDRLITNFHLPRSTLLILVCAFAGKELVFEAYRKAIGDQYRFFSYGDAMLIL